MTDRSRRWVVANLRRHIKQQQHQTKKRPAKLIPPQEQVRRYLRGEERWRLESGLITQQQYDRYVEAMEQKIQGG